MEGRRRGWLDGAVLEVRRVAADEAVSLLNRQDDSSEVSCVEGIRPRGRRTLDRAVQSMLGVIGGWTRTRQCRF